MDAETKSDFRKPESLVPMSDYTMDEAQTMYNYCGIVIEDFVPLMDDADPEDAALAEELEQRLKNPGFTKALLHISYQRANPRVSEAKLRRFFGTMDRTEAMERFLELVGDLDTEDDAGPPESQSKPGESSPKRTPENTDSSGLSSTPSSDEPEDAPETTGTDGSDTSSLRSAPTTLAR